MNIPKQLKEARFIKTHRKIAIEKGFPIELNRFERLADGSYIDKKLKSIYRIKNGEPYKGQLHSYSYEEINDYGNTLQPNNMSYGVLCGYNGLVVVDVDDEKTAKTLLEIPEFSKTFTCLSAKGLPHFYFYCGDYKPGTAFDSATKHKKRLIDIKATSGYVIGPGTVFFSNGTKSEYKVYNDSPISKIEYDDIIRLIEENIEVKTVRKQVNPYTNTEFIVDPISEEIFKKIDCDKILDDAGIDISSNPGDTPFAESEKKQCLHRTGYLWYDHHSLQGGTVITLYSKIHNIEYIQALYDLAEQAGVTDDVIRKATEYFVKNKTADLVQFLTLKFLKMNPCHTLRSSLSSPEIYIYNDGIYRQYGQTYIKEFCEKMTGKFYSSSIANKVIDTIIAKTYIESGEFYSDPGLNLIAVQNGLLDINTRELHPFTPDKIFLNKLPVEFNPNAKCENTIKHFETVLNGENDIKLMQETYGSLLYRKYDYEKAILFYGSGRNGKGKTMAQMGHLIGQDNFVNISLEDLGRKHFLLSELHNKMANLAGEIGNAALTDTKIFKMITGQDLLTADIKFKSPVTFRNYAKMIFCANEIPDSCDDSDGFWSRWIMIGFTKRFVPKSEYDSLQNRGLMEDNFRLMDTDISEKLTSPEELSGVLNWALDGLKRLRENNSFSYSDSIEEVRAIWRRKSSSAIGFIIDHVKYSYDATKTIIDEDLYSIFVEYCKKYKLKSIPPKDFRKVLMQENFTNKKTKVDGIHTYRWMGVEIQNWDFENKRFKK